MALSAEALKLHKVLEDEGKISGGTAKELTGFKDSVFKTAKTELKNYGLVTLGRGRGGTIELVEGVPLPEDAPKKSRAEMLADAREEKEYKSKVTKKYDKIKENAVKKGEKNYPEARVVFHAINLSEEIAYVEIWKDEKGAEVVGYYFE